MLRGNPRCVSFAIAKVALDQLRIGKMAKKKQFLKLDIVFDDTAIASSETHSEIDSAIESDMMGICLRLALVDDVDDGVNFTIYPDQINGAMTFSRDGDKIAVTVKGTYEFEYGKDEKEYLPLPVKLLVESVSDNIPESYYFNDDFSCVDTGIVIETISG